MFPWSRSKKNEPVPENIDVEENGSIPENIDVGEDHDDGIFVTETGRKRRFSVAKIISIAAIALLFAGVGAGTGYGITTAARRSKAPEAAVVVAEGEPEPAAADVPEDLTETADVLEDLAEPADVLEDSAPVIEEEAIPDELYLSMSMIEREPEETPVCCKCEMGGKSAKKSKKSKASKGSRALEMEMCSGCCVTLKPKPDSM